MDPQSASAKSVWPFPFEAQDWEHTPTAVQAYVHTLHNELTRLREQVEVLEARLQANSTTSHRPPASDSPYKKPRQRTTTTSRRKVGGKLGHPGYRQALLAPTGIVEDSTMRRSVIGLMLILAILVAPLLANAQPRGRVPRIGVLSSTSPSHPGPFLDGFRHGLHGLGWVEGQAIAVEWQWVEGKLDRLPELAADLVRRNVEVIVAVGTPASLAAKHATTTIPIVVAAGDLVHLGLVASLGQPGGNLTGVTLLAGEGFSGKWLELLKETAPALSRVAYLLHPDNLISVFLCKAAQGVAPALSLTVEAVEVRRPDELDRAFAVIAERAEALIVDADIFFAPYRIRIVEFAAHHRLAAIYQERSYVDAGGLMSYGPSVSALGRLVATYVDKILKGAKPADLPVEQPTKFELVINLKTAQALGITMPPSLLLLADEVIK